jgi:hypothetical protein
VAADAPAGKVGRVSDPPAHEPPTAPVVPIYGAVAAPPTAPWPAPPPGDAPPPAGKGAPKWLAVLLALLLIGGAGFAIGWFAIGDNGHSSSTPAATLPTSPSTTAPANPLAPALQSIGLHQADVASGTDVVLYPDGNRVGAEFATLDLCNGTFPSESLRVARLQVAAVNASGTDPNPKPAMSTEAVAYTNAAATQQAFSELRKVAASCPAGPVTSPVGEGTATTHFNAAPDGSWPQTAGVDRLAFDLVTTDSSGVSQRSVAVYLRRGRILEGVYFATADASQSTIKGQTTMSGIVSLFANRIAQLPASVVNS